VRRLAPLALALASCWGGGEGGGRVSALDGKTVVGGLDDRGLVSLCNEIDLWSQRQYGSAAFKRNQCEIKTAVALRTLLPAPAGARDACRTQATACEGAVRGQPSFTPVCQRWTGPCPLTVAELEQCLTDLAYNMYGLFLTAPMCDDICRDVNPLTLDAASCATVRASCLGFGFTRPSFPELERAPACP